MRLFVGALLSAGALKIIRDQTEAHPFPPGWRRLPPASLHVTLKFIGHTDAGNVSIYRSVLSNISSRFAPIKLRCEKCGVFPHKNRPRVFWTGIEGDVGRLAKISREIEDEFGRLNVPPENRRFSPHLTLARAEPGAAPIDELEPFYRSFQTEEFEVSEIHLIQSHLESRGASYQLLASFPLSLKIFANKDQVSLRS